MPHPQSPQPGNKALGEVGGLPEIARPIPSSQEAAWGLRWGGGGGMRGEGRRRERRTEEGREGSRVAIRGPAP